MAKPFGAHKRPKEWLRTRQTQDLINALAEGHKCTAADLVEVIKGGNNKLHQGTQIHQDLAFYYSLFLDTDFQVWVGEQIETLLQKGKVELDQIRRNLRIFSQFH